MTDLNLNALRDDVYAWAKSKGWWEPGETRTIGDLIALMHSELSEALEEHRDGHAPDHVYFRDADGAVITPESEQRAQHLGISHEGPFKPEGIPIELADVVIRIADFCGRYGIDLDEAVRMKLAYNRTRPWKHGGRVRTTLHSRSWTSPEGVICELPDAATYVYDVLHLAYLDKKDVTRIAKFRRYVGPFGRYYWKLIDDGLPKEPAQGLSVAEQEVLDHLDHFINGFRELPVFHHADVAEAVTHVHALQNMVMARAAQRALDYLYPRKP